MAHPQEIREKLRRLYVSGEQTLETAALMCEIPQTTARAWKRADKEKGDDWDKMRAAYTLAGGGIEDLSRAMLAGFMVQYNSTMTMLQDSSTEDLPRPTAPSCWPAWPMRLRKPYRPMRV